MRKFILGCLGVAAAAFALQAAPAEVSAGLFEECSPCAEILDCEPCDDAADCDPCDDVFCGKKSGWFFNGHIESGIWANEYGQNSVYSGARHGGFDTYSGNTGLMYNTQHTGYQLNQMYFSAGKSVDGSRGWDLGGTVDFTFGTDARFTQAAGMEYANGHDAYGWGTGDYYSSFAQAYFEAAYKKWNFKVGKFYAPFGSQSYKGVDNFFYSFTPAYGFLPSTATGAYATYTVNKKLSVFGGWVQPDQFGEDSDNNAFLGGLTWKPTKRLKLDYTLALGKDETYDIDYFVNAFVATYQITKKWEYVFDFSLTNREVPGYTSERDHILDYAFNNELIYRLNKKWAFGARYGYVNDKDYDWYWHSISLGANWTPNQWLVVKPELRYDVTNSDWTFNAYPGSRPSDHQLSGGFSTIVKF